MKSLIKFRSELNEGTQASSDFYISPETGRKVRARRINFGGYNSSSLVPKDQEDINKEFNDALEGKQKDIGVKKVQKIVQQRRREENKPLTTENALNPLHQMQPPQVLVLRRKTVRLFDNGMQVALYYNQALDKHFTVAMTPDRANYQAEETDSFLEILQSDMITHNDGNISNLTDEDKESLLSLYMGLSEDNKQKMQNKIFESCEEFDNLKQFALNNK